MSDPGMPGADDIRGTDLDEELDDEGLEPDEAELDELDDDALLSELVAERDDFRDALLRVKAEFDNYRKRVARERDTMVQQASARLVAELLTILDSCDAAIVQGATDVEPVHKALLDLLVKEGLEVLPATDVPFDPHLHEAVLHEEGDGAESVVVETLRTGYVWHGTVLRPAMVRVRG